jgi:hypothetical protein
MNDDRHNHGGHHHEDKPRRQYHKDWRVWVAVLAMLAALATYVLTNDETLRPAPSQPSAPVAPLGQ